MNFKHWKIISTHLKKYHKKYVFLLLSAIFLRKWISLVAAYTPDNNQFLVTQSYNIQNDNIAPETQIFKQEEKIFDENNDIEKQNENNIPNWICDYWDILIETPIQWDIVWKTFDISRKYTNQDCIDNEFIIKLRDSNTKYINIFTWNYDITNFSFDSTKLISEFYDTMWNYEWTGTNFFTWHQIAIVSDEFEVIYKWDEFIIDNKKPEISNIKTEFSTQNKNLNIWDSLIISFESDEELKNITVNILWQYATLVEKNWNQYKYSMEFSNNNAKWKVVYGVRYQDSVWNNGYFEWFEDRELYFQ